MPAFAQVFRASYKRVNKARQQNLRCFPGHSPTGHVATGFCGCPILMMALASESESAAYFGELVPSLSPPRSSVDDNGGMLSGTRRGAAIVFNSSESAWRYECASNRHALHVFRVYVVEGGVICAVCDSPKFRVSQFRNRNAEELLPALDPFRIVIRAIRDRVKTVDLTAWEDEEEDDALSDLDDAASLGVQNSADDALMLDSDAEARLLEMESLDALLESCARYIAAHFGKWGDLHALKADVEAQLARDGCKLNDVADRLQALLLSPHHLARAPAPVSMSHGDVLVQARKFALAVIPRGALLRDQFPQVDIDGAPNGMYRRPAAFGAYFDELRMREGGWSPVDLRLQESAPFTWLSVVNAQLLAMCHCGGPGVWGPCALYRMHVVNRPPDYRPLAFGEGSMKLVCVFAFGDAGGLVTVVSGVIDGAVAQVMERSEEGMSVKTYVARFEPGTRTLDIAAAQRRDFVFSSV